MDKEDYSVFLNLLKRHLSKEVVKDNKGRSHKHLYGKIELLAYCLMPNHFHLFFYQYDEISIRDLMHLVQASYTTYFNKKYNRRGTLYEDVYKASRIMDESYLLHITRYIHLNPVGYLSWEYSSLRYYLGEKSPSWLAVGKVSCLFGGVDEYKTFVADYEALKEELDELKHDLANTI
jgi:putative transposase